MKCPICLLPFDMDHPVFGRMIYRHVNRIARRESRRLVAGDRREAARKPPAPQ